MRFRATLLSVFAIGLFVLPHFAYAAIPFFGPIIPQTANQATCPAGWGMLMTVVNNIISLLITLAIVFVAPIMIAYAGFLYVINPFSPNGIGRAKTILLNTILGIVIALAAWLIVDAVMAVLYNPAAAGGTWYSLVSSGGAPFCLPQAGSVSQPTAPSGVSVSGSTVTPSGGTLAQCSSGNTACSPAALQAAGFTATQANVMSCIAVTESSGIPSTPPYNTTHPGSNSTACGTFQITQTTWNKYATGACSNFFSSCQNAACNAQVAQTLVSQNGYKDWTCANCNSKAASCIQQYGP